MQIQVELFGQARLLAGEPLVRLELPEGGSVREALSVLARRRPDLVGPVLLPDTSGPGPAYTLCLNGRTFLDELERTLEAGDALLLLPAAAGGQPRP